MHCFNNEVCNLEDSILLDNYLVRDKCLVEIRKCRRCNEFWKIKYRDKGNIYLRVEEMNGDFPCTFFNYSEVEKYGFKMQCNSDLKLRLFTGLSCNPDNLELIKVIESEKTLGTESEIAIKRCSSCHQVWKTYYYSDSHHGGYTVCLKAGESFEHSGGGSFSIDEASLYIGDSPIK
ncbi:MAG: hypothetical protein GX660_19980 [Clostridiaceae bacterium]|nr:hypothetical protein [Clostridiaceae bacterium]